MLEDSRGKTRLPAERRRIGYVFQDARLFPHLDALGNLRYAEKPRTRRREAHLAGLRRATARSRAVSAASRAEALRRRAAARRARTGAVVAAATAVARRAAGLAGHRAARRSAAVSRTAARRAFDPDDLRQSPVRGSAAARDARGAAGAGTRRHAGRARRCESASGSARHRRTGGSRLGAHRHGRSARRGHRGTRRGSHRCERSARGAARRTSRRERARSAARARRDPRNGAAGEHQRAQRDDRNDCAHRQRRRGNRHGSRRHRRTDRARARHARSLGSAGSAARQAGLGAGEGRVDSRSRVRAQSADRRVGEKPDVSENAGKNSLPSQAWQREIFADLAALQPPYRIGSSRDFWIVRNAKLECTRATPGSRVRCLLCKRSKSAVSATTTRTT